ncbi:MAG: nitrilase-related carbon-nitrogen hydrolase [Bacteroidota bacterium]|nr:nitrilase-related carbon-nitrogen hydrolase [Bacteroidota bacterium]
MFNIHLVQFNPQLAEIDNNIARLRKLMSGIEHSDLIILPELANSGYNFQSTEQAFNASESRKDHGPFLSFLQSKASEKQCHIVSGFCERDGDRLFNSAILLNAAGIVGLYRKIHLFMNEKDFFVPGDLEPLVYDIGGLKTAMLICFDYLFPELWRSLALKGADLVSHPSNLVTPYGARVAPVQGIINRFYVATANRTGTDHGITFNGGSFVSDPEGKQLALAGINTEEVIHAQIDPAIARNKMITGRNHVLKDRRPDFY